MVIAGETVPLMIFKREEDSGTGFQVAGGSAVTLTDFDVDLLNTNNVGTEREVVRKLRVRFKNGLVARSNPWADDQETIRKRSLDELMWGMTIEPPGLALQGFQG